MSGHNDNTSVWMNLAPFGFWIVGHLTLSNIALVVSICVGVLQAYKTIRDIRKDRR